ncbi:unnamed protein product [Tetraodon nigroviridis]|uniref:(spotted green pufferfish) hypothetical protein n=1 Tax=Tetraodon nigroviridis TaxID=99883 RepID=Q4RMK7_TETNG|nr:unnamed protein product [Tetraodon nigroviridis]
MRLSTFNSPSAIFALPRRNQLQPPPPGGAFYQRRPRRRSQLTTKPVRRPVTANTAASQTGTVLTVLGAAVVDGGKLLAFVKIGPG